MLRIYDADISLIDKIEKVYKKTLQKLVQKDIFVVEVSFVDNAKIKKMNRETRNIDKVTDILSFQNLADIVLPVAKRNYKSDVDPESGRIILGEIVIAEQVMLKQAAEYGHSVQRECCYLFLHGLLHLLGFDHLTEKDERVMRGHEEDILSSLKIVREKFV